MGNPEHADKDTGPIRQVLDAMCSNADAVASHVVQVALEVARENGMDAHATAELLDSMRTELTTIPTFVGTVDGILDMKIDLPIIELMGPETS